MGRTFKGRKTNSPPNGEKDNWIWHTRSLISSPAWRGRSINCVRVIEFLEIEHLAHGSVENGNLLATYNQLAEFGASRRFIWEAVGYAERMGLIEVKRGGKRGSVLSELSRYRLTYAWTRVKENGLWIWSEPTDEWKAKTEADIANWNAYVTVHKGELEATKTSRKVGAQRLTATVHKGELPSVHKGELENGQAIEIAQNHEVHKGKPPSISRVPNNSPPSGKRASPLQVLIDEFKLETDIIEIINRLSKAKRKSAADIRTDKGRDAARAFIVEQSAPGVAT